ncbi:unnamed protein product [Rodentolepis nana]|uniref:PK_C domain-containing protein n=1 Tax=Rodentolepis nana TaxID=102285 RepID=A0A0R3T4H1_RODNA|nr:unnamed protein product [Rodentolepis nana]
MLRPDDAQALRVLCCHSTRKYTHDHIMRRAGDALVAPIIMSSREVYDVCHEYNEISPRYPAPRMCRIAA